MRKGNRSNQEGERGRKGELGQGEQRVDSYWDESMMKKIQRGVGQVISLPKETDGAEARMIASQPWGYGPGEVFWKKGQQMPVPRVGTRWVFRRAHRTPLLASVT